LGAINAALVVAGYIAANRATRARKLSPLVSLKLPSDNRYSRLHDLLSATDEVEITLSFAKLESVLGVPLPDSARKYPAWWANQTPSSSQSGAWTSAGWHAHPNLKAQSVTFQKDAGLATLVHKNPRVPHLNATLLEEQLQEDEVKEHLRAFLETGGWRTTIASGKVRGIDIEAFREGPALDYRGERLWVAEPDAGELFPGCARRAASTHERSRREV
jgi:hypothetical protein